ncbi:hypothetical protein [Antarctobacter jejuensis]|uniref:hypothetical protein n=1 Tax=Antarctobacter jejuensis TaxID=1439938 RepID=UPI003FD3F6C7
MADHSWVADVLSDLERYLEENGGTASKTALSYARQIATRELGLPDPLGTCGAQPSLPGGEPRFELVVDNAREG